MSRIWRVVDGMSVSCSNVNVELGPDAVTTVWSCAAVTTISSIWPLLVSRVTVNADVPATAVNNSVTNVDS